MAQNSKKYFFWESMRFTFQYNFPSVGRKSGNGKNLGSVNLVDLLGNFFNLFKKNTTMDGPPLDFENLPKILLKDRWILFHKAKHLHQTHIIWETTIPLMFGEH